MGRFLAIRLAKTLLAVWVLASAVFLLAHRNPEEAARLALPDGADVTTRITTDAQTAASLTALRQRLGLDLPVFYLSPPTTTATAWRWNGLRNQYHRWLSELLRGNLGTSFRTGEPVTHRLSQALAYTLPLTGTAALLAGLLAVWLAQRLVAQPRWAGAVRLALSTVHALPLFVVALALLLLLANPDVLAWFPAYGLDQPDEPLSLSRYAQHLALPVAALTLTALPELTLQLEAALQHEMSQLYTTTARAKGLSWRQVIRRHVLRNALLPSIAQLGELLPALVAGAIAVEVVFAIPGMGRLLAEAAAARDYPVLIGGVLLTGATRLLALLLADVLYSRADPRIRWQA